MENIIPVIDHELLQKKANEYAQKGAEETIKEFYSGWNSPYRKAIEENLKNRGFDSSFELPDVVASINESLGKEIDKIANTAVAKTFIPMVSVFLTRAPKTIKFSEILKEFIESTDFNAEEDDMDMYSVEVRREDGTFRKVIISDDKDEYEVGFYNESRHNKEKSGWTIYSLPFTHSEPREKTMKISLDGGATLEMPFTKGVLENKFRAFIARLVMAETLITFDVSDFDEDMFPEKDHCHC